MADNERDLIEWIFPEMDISEEKINAMDDTEDYDDDTAGSDDEDEIDKANVPSPEMVQAAAELARLKTEYEVKNGLLQSILTKLENPVIYFRRPNDRLDAKYDSRDGQEINIP